VCYSDLFMREFFVVGKALNELQNNGHIHSGGITNRDRHKLRAKVKSIV